MDLKSLRAERKGSGKSVPPSRGLLSLDYSASHPTANSSVPVDSVQTFDRSQRGSSCSGTLLSRLSYVTEHVWHNEFWSYSDVAQMSYSAAFLLLVSGASWRVYVGRKRFVLLWVCSLWLMTYCMLSVVGGCVPPEVRGDTSRTLHASRRHPHSLCRTDTLDMCGRPPATVLSARRARGLRCVSTRLWSVDQVDGHARERF